MPGEGDCLGIKGQGFLGMKFLIPKFFWVRKFWPVLFGWLDGKEGFFYIFKTI